MHAIEPQAMSFVARTGSKIIRRQSGRFESFSSESFHRSDSVRRSSGTIKVSPYCCPHFTCLFPSQNFSARTQFLPIKAAAALLRCASLPRRHHASIRNSLCSYRPNARLLRRTAWLRFENKGFRCKLHCVPPCAYKFIAYSPLHLTGTSPVLWQNETGNSQHLRQNQTTKDNRMQPGKEK
jgi:hypothetical protein